MNKKNVDFSQLLSFDTKVTSKLNLEVLFKKHHSGDENRAFSIVPSLSPSLAGDHQVPGKV